MTSLISVTDKPYKNQSISHQYCWLPYREKSTVSAQKELKHYPYSLYRRSFHLLSCSGQKLCRYPWLFPLPHTTSSLSGILLALPHKHTQHLNISHHLHSLSLGNFSPRLLQWFPKCSPTSIFVFLEPILKWTTRETKVKADILTGLYKTSNGFYSNWDKVLAVAYKAHHGLVPGTSVTSCFLSLFKYIFIDF